VCVVVQGSIELLTSLCATTTQGVELFYFPGQASVVADVLLHLLGCADPLSWASALAALARLVKHLDFTTRVLLPILQQDGRGMFKQVVTCAYICPAVVVQASGYMCIHLPYCGCLRRPPVCDCFCPFSTSPTWFLMGLDPVRPDVEPLFPPGGARATHSMCHLRHTQLAQPCSGVG
jgi:hypothetical protein